MRQRNWKVDEKLAIVMEGLKEKIFSELDKKPRRVQASTRLGGTMLFVIFAPSEP